jgi:glutamine synthetase
MSVYTILRTGREGPREAEDESKKARTRFLPDNIYDAVRLFKGSAFAKNLF